MHVFVCVRVRASRACSVYAHMCEYICMNGICACVRVRACVFIYTCILHLLLFSQLRRELILRIRRTATATATAAATATATATPTATIE